MVVVVVAAAAMSSISRNKRNNIKNHTHNKNSNIRMVTGYVTVS